MDDKADALALHVQVQSKTSIHLMFVCVIACQAHHFVIEMNRLEIFFELFNRQKMF